MAWVQLSLTADRDQAALLEAALEGAGALSVTIAAATPTDDDAGPDADAVWEPAPDATPLWRQVRITALFADDGDGARRAGAAAAALAGLAATPPTISRLDDRPWEREWLRDFAPRRFGRRLWVCPHGQAVDEPDAVVVSLDPGLAFGTGHHPTTALCLEWLDAAPLAGRRLLDFGCGSGILAIAGLKLGAAEALAVDHDPQALTATADNADANGVAERLRAVAPGALPDGVADVVIANILAGPLIELAPTLARLTAPGGLFALSGILDGQVERVAAAYRSAFDLDAPLGREGWALLAGRRLPSS